jgi:hypothetical protein
VIKSRYYSILNKEDFLKGTFDDLMDMGRLGIADIEPARKKEKENREHNIELHQPC